MQGNPDSFVLLDAAVPDQRAQWLDLWQTWPDRDVAAHPGYAQLFARPQDKLVCACQIGTEGGILFPLRVRLLCTESWGAGAAEVCDLVSPYGYGGPFGWGSYEIEPFWIGFDKWAQAIGAVSLFTRFSLFNEQRIPFYGDTLVKGPCVMVSLEPPADTLLRSYDKSARENVRQAERAGVTIEADPQCRRLNEFLTVYYSTMNRLGALSIYYFPKPFFETLIAEFPNQVMLFHTLYHQRVVSSELLLISGDYLTAFLGGTLEEGMPVRANQLLRHGVNLWGATHGMKQVILGGGYAGEDSLFQYKKKFAPDGVTPFKVGTHIFHHDRYQSLIRMRREWEMSQGTEWHPKAEFFPLYRG